VVTTWGDPTKPGSSKPGNSEIGLGLGNKVKDRVKIRVRN